ncbi:carboxyl transferase domain-containing protein [Streptomyces ovatisporus]|uniref:Acetyl-coenzyme A carboxylase carboxyl transferase subunits beta/alpha n=1 Tax=Streptomyces ovatisporus TaxID=1128682 RepID=A0ABV9ACP7_9ACTN
MSDGARPRKGLSARGVIRAVSSGFTELPGTAAEPGPGGHHATDGPLAWNGYGAARERAAERTGESESVVCGTAVVGDVEAVLISFEFGFLGGSLGARTGDRVAAAYAQARARKMPVVSLIATGGSRMQEGMVALSQLQRVAQESMLARRAGVPQLAVLRDPATGGGWATLGAGADVVLALPGAQVAFAGSRVRPQGVDPRPYSAEGQWEAGHVDQIVGEEELRGTLARWLTLLTGGSGAAPPPPEALPGGSPASVPADGQEAVARARDARRPPATAYLDDYFETREDVRGDRCGGVDEGMLCGFGRREGRTVAYAAQCGTATRPAGFRTAARLIRTADRLGIPVLTLIDTPGAANDAEAEHAGAGPAIADAFAAVAEAAVPVTSLLIGEGGSGGALALAAPGRLWVTPDSYFSVIAPELAAAILKRTPDEVPRTADELWLRPQDVVRLGIARGVVGARARQGSEPRSSAA